MHTYIHIVSIVGVVGEEKVWFLRRLHEEAVKVVAEYVILHLVQVQVLL